MIKKREILSQKERSQLFNGKFSDLTKSLRFKCCSHPSDQERIRWSNVLDTFSTSKGVKKLAKKCFEKSMKDGQEPIDFPQSLINFTIHMAQYEQQATGEPGKDEIKYPNDLSETISYFAAHDQSFGSVMADYFTSEEHLQSDPDITRVCEFLALRTAMIKLNLSDKEKSMDINDYKVAKEHIGEIADYLQYGISWNEIFQFQKQNHWRDFKFFLFKEDSYKMTYPGRYTDLIIHVFDKLNKQKLLPEGKLRMSMIGLGDGPEMLPIIQLLGGVNNFEDIFASDLYSPTLPFPMVKAIDDGKFQTAPENMIMDPIGFLKANNFHPYSSGVNICDKSTIPPEMKDIDVSTMFGVLYNIDGNHNQDKDNLKMAMKNWISTGKEGGIFMAVWLARAYIPINVMVLRKIKPEEVNVDEIRNNPALKPFFDMKYPEGDSPVWTDDEIRQLGIKIIFPDTEEVQSLQPNQSWMRRFMTQKLYGAGQKI